MRVIGLTGGIGSGKSTVARMFGELGGEIIDADALAREVVAPGAPALKKIAERFGPDVLDASGGLDRRKLGQVVFGDATLRAELNAIVHPAVAARTQEELVARVAKGAKHIFYDVPLLFENGLERSFPVVIVVTVPPEVQRERVRARDGLPPEEIEARIRSQIPLEEKVKRATFVIDNSGPLEETRRQVEEIWGKLDAAMAAAT